MVHTVELSCVLYAHHVTDTLYDTDGPVVSGLVRTYRTGVVVGDHPACSAIFHLVAQIVYGGGEVMHVLCRLLQKVKRQAQSAAASHSGKRADGIYGLLEKF
jgi:hypothetical protein